MTESRTELAKRLQKVLGDPVLFFTHIINYMMGHTVSTYNDIKMKDMEFLRILYASSVLSIKTKNEAVQDRTAQKS